MQNIDIKSGIGLIERRLWRVEEYHDMVEAGILHEDDRVELQEKHASNRHL
jgi:hypothetical protein